jgi:oligopeptide/dipeptide ABC transporter ATP-binding protein
MSAPPILAVRGLSKHFWIGYFLARERLVAVDDVDFELPRGETLGLVGESGSGKSTLARCVLRLIEPTAGEIVFDGVSLTRLKATELRRLYRRMQMVFQDHGSSLNPRMTVRDTVTEPLQLHLELSGRACDARVRELMELVGLSSSHLGRFPHQLSGGQRQRVGIARAIATNPDLVILDEPTSSLDVSVRGQILQLLRDLQARLGLAYLFISHDLGVVRHVCQRVAVMYLGKIVEHGTTTQVFGNPQHPYTRALLSAAPRAVYGRRRDRLKLRGEIPSPIDLPRGCRLCGRCPEEVALCSTRHPSLVRLEPGHLVACYVAAERARQAGSSAAGMERSAAPAGYPPPSTHHPRGGRP